MKPIRTKILALMAGPALALALAGTPAPGIAAPPAALAPAPAAPALRAQLKDAAAALDRMRRNADAFRAELQLAADEIPPTLAARFQVRLGQMERSIRELTGKVEDLAYKLAKAEKDNEKFRNDIEFRLKELEQGRTASRRAPADRTAPNTPPRRTDPGTDRSTDRSTDRTAGPVTLPDGAPAEQYRFAIEMLRKAQYKAAASAFRQFIKRHPKHPLTGNAHYWLGEAFYVQGDFREAAILFADGFRNFPRHAKAPDTLLKLGMTMARLNKNQEACAALAELRRRFPKAGGHIRRAAAAERRKLGCSA